MLGKASVDYPRMVMQLDSTDGVYESAGKQSHGLQQLHFLPLRSSRLHLRLHQERLLLLKDATIMSVSAHLLRHDESQQWLQNTADRPDRPGDVQ